KSARPQAELLGIDLDLEVAAPAVLPGLILAAVDHPLFHLRHAAVQGDAPGCQVIAPPAPITAERRAREHVTRVRPGLMLRVGPRVQHRPQKDRDAHENCRSPHRPKLLPLPLSRAAPLHHPSAVPLRMTRAMRQVRKPRKSAPAAALGNISRNFPPSFWT